jgi:pimeloyl-ACP methyl ester carboxylesterase
MVQCVAMEARRNTVASEDVELAVWERGDPSAPTVVLVHGYPDTHVVWDAVATDLAADHHVVTYDVRGAGQSTAPADVAGYHLDHLMADLEAVVDATSAEQPVHLVGHDWGSIQGWEAVTCDRLDGRIASFTSISGPSLDHASRWMREHRTLDRSSLRDLVRQGSRSWYVAMFQIPGLADLGWRTFVPKMITRYLHRVEEVPIGAGPAETLPSDGRNGLELYRQNVRDRIRGSEPRTTDVPVQLVVAPRDRYVTPQLLDGLERIAPRLTRREIDAGHWLVITRAAELSDLVREHVARVATSAG